jgi:hemerythrin
MLTRMLALILDEHNQLEKAIGSIARPRDMDSVIKLFAAHTVDEERVMQEVQYSDYIKHRHEHDAIINTLKDLSLACDIIELRYHVNQVISNHIKEFDMPLLNGLEMENDSRNKTRDEDKA